MAEAVLIANNRNREYPYSNLKPPPTRLCRPNYLYASWGNLPPQHPPLGAAESEDPGNLCCVDLWRVARSKGYPDAPSSYSSDDVEVVLPEAGFRTAEQSRETKVMLSSCIRPSPMNRSSSSSKKAEKSFEPAAFSDRSPRRRGYRTSASDPHALLTDGRHRVSYLLESPPRGREEELRYFGCRSSTNFACGPGRFGPRL